MLPQVFGSQCSRIEILRLIVLKRLGFRQHCCQLQIFKGNTGTSQPSLAMFYYFTDYGPLGAVVCASLSKRSKTSCECLNKREIDKLKMLNWLQLAIDSYCSLKTSMKLNTFVLELGVFLSLSQNHILSKTDRASYRMARLLQMLTMWVLVLLLHIQNVKTDVRKPCAMIEDWFPSDVEPQSSKPPYVLDVIRQRNGKSVLEDLYQNKPRYDWHENYTSKMTFLTDNKFLSRDICTWVQI